MATMVKLVLKMLLWADVHGGDEEVLGKRM